MDKLEVFRKYEVYFNMVQDGYIRNHRKFVSNEIADAYEKLTKKTVNRNWGCGSCVMKFYKEVGEWYFNELKKSEKAPKPAKTDKTNTKTNGKTKSTKKTTRSVRSLSGNGKDCKLDKDGEK